MKLCLVVILCLALVWCQGDRARTIAERLWNIMDFDGNGRVTVDDMKSLLLAGDANDPLYKDPLMGECVLPGYAVLYNYCRKFTIDSGINGYIKLFHWLEVAGKALLRVKTRDGKIDMAEFKDPFELVTGTCSNETTWIFNRLANWTDSTYPTTDPRFLEGGNIEAVHRHADVNNNGFIIQREFMIRFVALFREMEDDGVMCTAPSVI